jgi:Reverse transcriptase (RNA-dependent DNA polymerase)
VRIGILDAALNNLDNMSVDIQGAYLKAPCKEEVYTRCGPVFGPKHMGKIALVVKALYGLKTSVFAWREHLLETIKTSLEFSPCYADADVWMRPAVKTDGTKFYELIFVHTDNLLVISNILTHLDQHYVLKPGSIGRTTQYLGSEIGEYRLADYPTKDRWYSSENKYIK